MHVERAPNTLGRGLVVVAAVIVGALLLCGGLAAWAVGSSLFMSVTEKDDVRVVLDRFMRRMADKDPASAYALFSSRAKRNFAVAELERTGRHTDYVLFDGYRDVEITAMTVRTGVNTNPNVPQGIVAEVSATVSYAGSFSGRLQAVLEKEHGSWMFDVFNVTVPPEKVSASSPPAR
jgi:hypothetical protein